MNAHVDSSHLTKFDALRVNRDKVMDLGIFYDFSDTLKNGSWLSQ